jgi:hypothetical protein
MESPIQLRDCTKRSVICDCWSFKQANTQAAPSHINVKGARKQTHPFTLQQENPFAKSIETNTSIHIETNTFICIQAKHPFTRLIKNTHSFASKLTQPFAHRQIHPFTHSKTKHPCAKQTTTTTEHAEPDMMNKIQECIPEIPPKTPVTPTCLCSDSSICELDSINPYQWSCKRSCMILHEECDVLILHLA